MCSNFTSHIALPHRAQAIVLVYSNHPHLPTCLTFIQRGTNSREHQWVSVTARSQVQIRCTIWHMGHIEWISNFFQRTSVKTQGITSKNMRQSKLHSCSLMSACFPAQHSNKSASNQTNQPEPQNKLIGKLLTTESTNQGRALHKTEVLQRTCKANNKPYDWKISTGKQTTWYQTNHMPLTFWVAPSSCALHLVSDAGSAPAVSLRQPVAQMPAQVAGQTKCTKVAVRNWS